MSKNETSGQDSHGIDLKTTLCDDGRERPTRSESADFGGEASGMDDFGGTAEIDDTDARRDDAPETCDHCGEPPELTLTEVSSSDWNDFGQLCTTCVLDVGGPGEAPTITTPTIAASAERLTSCPVPTVACRRPEDSI